jgi:hypothetical protein
MGTGTEAKVSGQFNAIGKSILLNMGFKISKGLGISPGEAGAAHAKFND